MHTTGRSFCLSRYLGSLYFAYTLSTCFLVAAMPGHGQPAQPQPAVNPGTVSEAERYEQAREELAISFRNLKNLRRDLDESSFNPRALADQIGGDVEALFEFVRDKVAFQPYAGVMRRAEGTLMSMSGNSYDQSLLLSALLSARGIENRFAIASLSGDVARDALALQSPASRDFALSVPLDVAELLPEGVDLDLASQVQADLETIALGRLTESYWFDYQLLDRELQGSGFDPRRLALPKDSSWLETARNHCWIQALIDGTWVDLDPSSVDLSVGDSLSTEARTTDSLDANLLTHKLVVRMELETTASDQATVVLERAINLMEAVNHIRLSTFPENLTGVDAIQAPDFLDSIEVLRPVIEINGIALGGQLFNLAGELLSDDQNVRNATELKSTQSAGFGALSAGLSGLLKEPEPGDAPVVELERVWVEFEMVSPSGEKRTQRRLWAERSGKDTETGLTTLRLGLLAGADIISSASNIAPSFMVAKRVDQLLENRSALMALQSIEAGRTPSNISQTLDNRVVEFPLDLLDLHSQRGAMLADQLRRDFSGLSAWTDGPFTVMARSGGREDLDGSVKIWESLDILHNAIEVVSVDSNASSAAMAELRIRQGIIDTQLEFHALGGTDEVINTHTVLRTARGLGKKFLWISPGDLSALDAIDVPSHHRIAMQRDVSAGFALLAPVTSVSHLGQQQFAWWRLDPVTGETLGMADRGAGQAMAEYAEAAADGALFGSVICGFVSVMFVQDVSFARRAGEYAKCVVMSAIGGGLGHAAGAGSATTWGGHLFRSGVFNHFMCSLSRAFAAIDSDTFQTYFNPSGLEDSAGSAVRSGGGGDMSLTGEVAGHLSCMAVGMVIGASGYMAQGGPAGAIQRENAKLLEKLSQKKIVNTRRDDFGQYYEKARTPYSAMRAPPSPGNDVAAQNALRDSVERGRMAIQSAAAGSPAASGSQPARQAADEVKRLQQLNDAASGVTKILDSG